MNDENINEDATPRESASEATEVLEALVTDLQDEVDRLGNALETSSDRVAELEAALDASPALTTTEPAGDGELRALAATARQAQRNGHPDAGKHVDALLIALGAA